MWICWEISFWFGLLSCIRVALRARSQDFVYFASWRAVGRTCLPEHSSSPTGPVSSTVLLWSNGYECYLALCTFNSLHLTVVEYYSSYLYCRRRLPNISLVQYASPMINSPSCCLTKSELFETSLMSRQRFARCLSHMLSEITSSSLALPTSIHPAITWFPAIVICALHSTPRGAG